MLHPHTSQQINGALGNMTGGLSLGGELCGSCVLVSRGVVLVVESICFAPVSLCFRINSYISYMKTTNYCVSSYIYIYTVIGI